MSNVAAEVRRRKEAHPELYCANPKCLWRIKSGPCPKHPVAPAPVGLAADAATSRPCNRCDRVVGLRVEVFTSSQRFVVCAACAVEMTHEDASARIVAHTPPMVSLFVCADGWYSPIALNAKLHQDTLNAETTRFADRVRAYAERHAMEAAS